MFFIVRHGNTFETGEPPRRIGARTDLALTDKGLEQAQALGRYFTERGVTFDRALISPLTRTRQTAEAILAQQTRPAPPTACEFLREIDYGCDENRPEEDVRARIGAPALDAWDSHAKVPNGWIVAPGERMAAWRALFARSQTDNQTTLLVTSNGAARFALLCDRGLTKAAAELASLKLPTGGFGVISRKDDGTLKLEEWGTRP